jgi:hypothetical protein
MEAGLYFRRRFRIQPHVLCRLNFQEAIRRDDACELRPLARKPTVDDAIKFRRSGRTAPTLDHGNDGALILLCSSRGSDPCDADFLGTSSLRRDKSSVSVMRSNWFHPLARRSLDPCISAIRHLRQVRPGSPFQQRRLRTSLSNPSGVSIHPCSQQDAPSLRCGKGLRFLSRSVLVVGLRRYHFASIPRLWQHFRTTICVPALE